MQSAAIRAITSAANRIARRRLAITRPRLRLAIEADAVQFHAMVDQAEAQLLGDRLLQLLQFRIDEFDDLARLDVDQVIVVRFR